MSSDSHAVTCVIEICCDVVLKSVLEMIDLARRLFVLENRSDESCRRWGWRVSGPLPMDHIAPVCLRCVEKL